MGHGELKGMPRYRETVGGVVVGTEKSFDGIESLKHKMEVIKINIQLHQD